MLSKLATHAEAGDEHARSEAGTELREQVDRLLAGWNLDDPNPNDYSKTLQRLASTAGSESREADGGSSEHEADPLRLIQTGLEVGGSGPLVDRAIDRAIDSALIRELRALTAAPPSCGNIIAELI